MPILGALPATGVDLGQLITDGIQLLGGVVVVAVGGFVAFRVITKALRWVTKALAG